LVVGIVYREPFSVTEFPLSGKKARKTRGFGDAISGLLRVIHRREPVLISSFYLPSQCEQGIGNPLSGNQSRIIGNEHQMVRNTGTGSATKFAYRDTRALVDQIQRDMTRAAVERIGQFMQSVGNQLQDALVSGSPGVPDLRSRHVDLIRLLRIAPAVSDAAWLDAQGRERVRVSRFGSLG